MGTKRALIHQSEIKGTDKEVSGDNKRTPEHAVEIILPFLKREVPPPAVLWEPTSWGDGNNPFKKVLERHGYSVVETGIETGEDFLTYLPKFRFDAIITNPPYSLKTEFIRKCYEYEKPWFLLLPITAIEGKSRWGLYEKNGVNLVLPKGRIEFDKESKSGSWFYVAWFFWIPKSENGRLYFYGKSEEILREVGGNSTRK